MTQTADRLTLAQFITAHGGITASATPSMIGNPNMDDGDDMDHWRVTLRYLRTSGDRELARRRLTVYFSMGRGHNGRVPEAADVLDCLASDSASVATTSGHAPSDFKDWCDELGYDTDSRKAYRTYTICKRQAERLRKFLGEEAYERLLWHTERL